jgi:hypothetical protein
MADTDGYILGGEVYCEHCIREHLKAQDEVLIKWPDMMGGGSHLIRTEDMMRELVEANGGDFDNPHTWDSSAFPKGPYDQRNEESDSPTNCSQCGAFLENPLTQDGLDYVAEMLLDYEKNKNDAAVDGSAMVEWRNCYGGDHMRDGRTLDDYLDEKVAEALHHRRVETTPLPKTPGFAKWLTETGLDSLTEE